MLSEEYRWMMRSLRVLRLLSTNIIIIIFLITIIILSIVGGGKGNSGISSTPQERKSLNLGCLLLRVLGREG